MYAEWDKQHVLYISGYINQPEDLKYNMIVVDTNNLNNSYKCKLNPAIDIYFLQKNTIFNKWNKLTDRNDSSWSKPIHW